MHNIQTASHKYYDEGNLNEASQLELEVINIRKIIHLYCVQC